VNVVLFIVFLGVDIAIYALDVAGFDVGPHIPVPPVWEE
jgi:hypothetical protein